MKRWPTLKSKLRVKRFLDRGVKKLRFQGFADVLQVSALPAEYMPPLKEWPTTNAPAYTISDGDLCLYIPSESLSTLERFKNAINTETKAAYLIIPPTAEITRQEIKDITKWLQAAGSRLVAINRRLAEENKGWEGEEVIEI